MTPVHNDACLADAWFSSQKRRFQNLQTEFPENCARVQIVRWTMDISITSCCDLMPSQWKQTVHCFSLASILRCPFESSPGSKHFKTWFKSRNKWIIQTISCIAVWGGYIFKTLTPEELHHVSCCAAIWPSKWQQVGLDTIQLTCPVRVELEEKNHSLKHQIKRIFILLWQMLCSWSESVPCNSLMFYSLFWFVLAKRTR